MIKRPDHYFEQKPKLVIRMLHWCLPKALQDAVIGDLEETYFNKQQLGQARWLLEMWLWRQSISVAYRFMPTTQRGMMMFLLSLVVFLAMMSFGMVMGADFSAFIDVPSAMLVLPPALFFAIAATSWQSFLMALGCVVSDQVDMDEMDLLRSQRVFAVLGNSAMWCGAISTLIGWVAIASNVSADEFSTVIGPAFAVSVLTLYYGAIIKLICYVAEQRILNKVERI